MAVEAKVLEKEKDYLEVQLEGVDEGFANAVVEKLLANKSVTFAASTLVHPLITTPVLKVRAADAKKEVLSALEEVSEDSKKSLKALEKL